MLKIKQEINFSDFITQADENKTYIIQFNDKIELINRDIEAVYLTINDNFYDISEFYSNVYKPLKLEFFRFEETEYMPLKLSFNSILDWYIGEEDLEKILRYCCNVTLPHYEDVNNYFLSNSERYIKQIEQKIGLSLTISDTGDVCLKGDNDNSVMDNLRGAKLINTYTDSNIDYEVKVHKEYGCIVDNKFYVFEKDPLKKELSPIITILDIKED